jgi:hypothetical protein
MGCGRGMQSWEYCTGLLGQTDVGVAGGGKHRAWDSAKAPNSKYSHVGNLCNTAKEPSAVKGSKRTPKLRTVGQKHSGNRATDPGDTQEDALSLTSGQPVGTGNDWPCGTGGGGRAGDKDGARQPLDGTTGGAGLGPSIERELSWRVVQGACVAHCSTDCDTDCRGQDLFTRASSSGEWAPGCSARG